jgi:ATP-dependent DNA ligase
MWQRASGRSAGPPRHKATDAMLYAFDLLELDGEDLRALPLVKRARRNSPG